uniref:G_PROTEIN_RECEP_F1_2 domain-containing protein n=1 Tax=Globodera rostochiensis TaxID=31243 RepID=A0A914HUE3_GLORO
MSSKYDDLDCYPCWPLIGSAFAFGCIAIVGLVTNASVIYITFKTKALRGTANYLLALTSTFEILHQLGHFLFVYTAFSGINFIDYRLSVQIGTFFLFGLFGTNLSIFFTGFDRFFCVFLPTSYKCIKLRPYLAKIGLICALISTFVTVLFHIGAESMPDVKITGTIGDLLKGSAGTFYIKFGLTTNALTIVMYIATGILVRKKSAAQNVNSNANAFNKRIFRSLFLIVSVNVGGYFVVAVFLTFVAPKMDPIPIATSNGPILYATSSTHRKAFHLHFPFVFKHIGVSSSSPTVMPMTVGNIFKEYATPGNILKEYATPIMRGVPSVRQRTAAGGMPEKLFFK